VDFELPAGSATSAKLGGGSFGSVVAATAAGPAPVPWDPRALVALKVFDASFRASWFRESSVAAPAWRWETEGAPMDFLREAQLLSELRHPRIVEVQSLLYATPSATGLVQGLHGAWVLGMTHAVGGDVSSFIENELGNKPPRTEPMKSRVKRIVSDLCAAVAHCHAHSVMHRDIKPNNLLLDAGGRLRMADFGWSRRVGHEAVYDWSEHIERQMLDQSGDDNALNEQQQQQQQFTLGPGTCYYKAPEVLRDPRNCNYTLAVDNWAVGCVIAELLTGQVLIRPKSPRILPNSQTNSRLLARMQDIFGADELPMRRWCPIGAAVTKTRLASQPRRLFEHLQGLGAEPDPSTWLVLDCLLQLDPAKRLTATQAAEATLIPEPAEWGEEGEKPPQDEDMEEQGTASDAAATAKSSSVSSAAVAGGGDKQPEIVESGPAEETEKTSTSELTWLPIHADHLKELTLGTCVDNGLPPLVAVITVLYYRRLCLATEQDSTSSPGRLPLEVRAKRAQGGHPGTEQFSSIMGCFLLATQMTLLSYRVTRGKLKVQKPKKLAPCDLVIGMARRALKCGAFIEELRGDITWGRESYFNLQTRVIAKQREVLLCVNLGRNEAEENAIARALGLRHHPLHQARSPAASPMNTPQKSNRGRSSRDAASQPAATAATSGLPKGAKRTVIDAKTGQVTSIISQKQVTSSMEDGQAKEGKKKQEEKIVGSELLAQLEAAQACGDDDALRVAMAKLNAQIVRPSC
jgi:serine/threonine protein kinase